jgi:NAD(P)-dependent dehydrogenase (short-subunit alcohol dehydrogenase family)
MVVDTITAEGGKARFVAADLTDPAQVDQLVDQAGAVDVLVNNAGFSWFGPTAELDVATFDRLFAANVRVNAIAAGPVLTNGAAPARTEALGAPTLLARAAQPGEIASVIAFLASSQASCITGAVIAADGGRTAI